MPAKPPRCKICEHEHWNWEPHVLPRSEQKPVTRMEKPVTPPQKPVTVAHSVTSKAEKPVTVVLATEKPVTPTGGPVVRGKRGPARLYATNADRQRAYRARRTPQ
jgi:hypothetical protein